MTREEAINVLYGIKADNLNLADAYTKDKYDALTSAIEALDQEPCDDCISRSEIRKHIYQRLYESALNNVGYECTAEDVFMDIADNRLNTWISEIPSFQQRKEQE